LLKSIILFVVADDSEIDNGYPLNFEINSKIIFFLNKESIKYKVKVKIAHKTLSNKLS
jgi:hypothetical protein